MFLSSSVAHHAKLLGYVSIHLQPIPGLLVLQKVVINKLAEMALEKPKLTGLYMSPGTIRYVSI